MTWRLPDGRDAGHLYVEPAPGFALDICGLRARSEIEADFRAATDVAYNYVSEPEIRAAADAGELHDYDADDIAAAHFVACEIIRDFRHAQRPPAVRAVLALVEWPLCLLWPFFAFLFRVAT